MNNEDFMKLVEEIIQNCKSIIKTKGTDYAGDVDRFMNFKRNAEISGLTKYQVWLIYFNKQVDAIQSTIKQHPSKPLPRSEPLRERIVDVINYSLLLAGMLAEDGVYYEEGQTNTFSLGKGVIE